MSEEKEKKTRKIYGDWVVTDPTLVIKIGMVYDSYKEPHLEKIWRKGFKQGVHVLPNGFMQKDCFYKERGVYNKEEKILFECRYYTPNSNRQRITHDAVEDQKLH